MSLLSRVQKCAMLTRDVWGRLLYVIASLLLLFLAVNITVSDYAGIGNSESLIEGRDVLHIFFTRLFIVSVCLLLLVEELGNKQWKWPAASSRKQRHSRFSIVVLFFLVFAVMLMGYDLWILGTTSIE